MPRALALAASLALAALPAALGLSAARAVAPGSPVTVFAPSGWLQVLVTRKLADAGFAPIIPAQNITLCESLLGPALPSCSVIPPSEWKAAAASSAAIVTCPEDRTYAAADLEELYAEASPALQRIVMVSKFGVQRRKSDLRYAAMNFLGGLDKTAKAEDVVRSVTASTGVPHTILRAGKMMGGGGPFGLGTLTYDKNADYDGMLKDRIFDAGTLGVELRSGDVADGQTGRVALADAIVQCLRTPAAANADLAVCAQRAKEPPTAEEYLALFEAAAPADLVP